MDSGPLCAHFEYSGGVGKIDDDNMPLSSPYHHKRVLNIHGVTPFWEVDICDRVGTFQVPVLRGVNMV